MNRRRLKLVRRPRKSARRSKSVERGERTSAVRKKTPNRRRKKKQPRKPKRPAWDSTVSDLDKYKLPRAQQIERKMQMRSHNLAAAQLELERKRRERALRAKEERQVRQLERRQVEEVVGEEEELGEEEEEVVEEEEREEEEPAPTKHAYLRRRSKPRFAPVARVKVEQAKFTQAPQPMHVSVRTRPVSQPRRPAPAPVPAPAAHRGDEENDLHSAVMERMGGYLRELQRKEELNAEFRTTVVGSLQQANQQIEELTHELAQLRQERRALNMQYGSGAATAERDEFEESLRFAPPRERSHPAVPVASLDGYQRRRVAGRTFSSLGDRANSSSANNTTNTAAAASPYLQHRTRTEPSFFDDTQQLDEDEDKDEEAEDEDESWLKSSLEEQPAASPKRRVFVPRRVVGGTPSTPAPAANVGNEENIDDDSVLAEEVPRSPPKAVEKPSPASRVLPVTPQTSLSLRVHSTPARSRPGQGQGRARS